MIEGLGDSGAVHEVVRLTGIEQSRVRFYEARFAAVFEAAGLNPSRRPPDPRYLDLLRQIDRMVVGEKMAVEQVRAEMLRRHQQQRQALSVVAVTSGKGGVGKTTVSVNLAIALSRLGLRTLLFDADLGLANVHVYAGLTPRGTLSDVVNGRSRLDEVVVPGPASVQVVCGDSGVARMADLTRPLTEYLARELEQLSLAYDVIVVDTAAGISAQVVEFLRVADDIVLVTTPNLAATLDAYSVVKVARQNQVHGTMGVLVNQVDREEQGAEVYEKIAGCADRFLGARPALLGHLFRSRLVERANAARHPLVVSHPTCKNARLFRAYAAALFEPRVQAANPEMKEEEPVR